ncbi:MAG: type IV secretion system DNA-binding domain-containing protein [Rhodospirillaceae bacterium]|nr:type IV secretion system DNA-binding domain-containing protein [Rhodospirillaceae bacterium]MDE0363024.1 type IV secretion system DNA-binding domain-containing protein [Rhodospirillaceae bacterium]
MISGALGENTVRGGQTVFHGLRMWGQVARAGLLLVAALVVAVPAAQLWRAHSGYDAYAVAMYTLAETKLAIGYAPDSGQELRLEDGGTRVSTIADIVAYEPWRAVREGMLETVYSGARLGAKTGGGAVLTMLAWFAWRGYRLKRSRRVRGAELVSAFRLRWRVDPFPVRVRRLKTRKPAPYRVAGVPYPERTETQHTFVSGTTGSGKTVLISDLVQQIRDRGERCLIYDKMGSYTRTFFNPARDVLLNPLDGRAPRWSPFCEARSPRDFDTMAAALIPQQKDTVDPFWVTAARQLFSHGAAGLWQKGERTNRALVDHLLKTDLTALAGAMKGTAAQSIVDENNPKTALSVRAMLTANIGALELLTDSGRPFSIREWISGDRENGFLFLTSRGDQHASLRGLISMWLEIAVNALLSLEQDDERRVWVVLDELPTLHQVPSLQPGLAESRQFGGCFVLGAQVASALRDLYGRNGAETMSSLCGTRVVLAAPDSDTALWSANSLGRAEVEALGEGVSYGADPYRDGVTLTRRREMQPLVLPSEIMRLENLHGFIKVPGCHPVARIRLRYVKRPEVAPRFVPAAPGKTVGQPLLPLLPPPEDEKAKVPEAPAARGETAEGAGPPGRADGGNRPPEDADADVWGELDRGVRRPGRTNWT